MSRIPIVLVKIYEGLFKLTVGYIREDSRRTHCFSAFFQREDSSVDLKH